MDIETTNSSNEGVAVSAASIRFWSMQPHGRRVKAKVEGGPRYDVRQAGLCMSRAIYHRTYTRLCTTFTAEIYFPVCARSSLS